MNNKRLPRNLNRTGFLGNRKKKGYLGVSPSGLPGRLGKKIGRQIGS